jgi:hypothetical protein
MCILPTFDNSPFWKERNTLPPCPLYGDTVGRWVNMKDIDTPEKRREVNQHFILQEPKDALSFTHVWLPEACSYHRFTNESAYRMALHLLKDHRRYPTKMLDIALVGDSASRGIFCGITRILSGSELYGPCDNIVCGGSSGQPVSYHNPNAIYPVTFHNIFKFSFIYIYDLADNSMEVIRRLLSSSRPYALILNSGAWDFDGVARSGQHNPNISTCDTPDAVQISKNRASSTQLKYFHDLSMFSLTTKTRLIYRNSHYNKRYGVYCADELLEKNLLNQQQKIDYSGYPKWEIWNNREISKEVYDEQCWDGFHFDRHRINGYEHGISHMDYFYTRGWTLPGELEIQLAQSLLNALFHSVIIEEYEKMEKDPNFDVKKEEEEDLAAVNYSKFKFVEGN